MKNVERAARRLLQLLAQKPRLAIVLGSGFQPALNSAEILSRVPFAKIPGFPRLTVPGHRGEVILARVRGMAFLALGGRAHFYEGWSMDEITFPIRVLARCGVRDLLLTNAAGGIHPKLRPGDLMYLTDHINLMGTNPLRGAGEAGDPFVDLSRVYDQELRALLKKAARHVKARVRPGVYLAVSGPSYETPAEIRAFARLGADAVGMSTVPEAIVARQCGMRVAALSCITNLAAGRSPVPLTHAEVLAVGERFQARAAQLLIRFIRLYGAEQSRKAASYEWK